jgi:UDP-glucose 4-epimerase
MIILITGSAGFVGKHLVKLLSKNHTIVRYDLKNGQDIFNSKLLTKKMKGVDVVIHLAAHISAIESWERPLEYMKNNSLGTLAVMEVAIKSGVKKMIFFSSAAAKAKPYTPYAVSKMSAEQIVKLYSDKINTVIVRPENIYGLGQKEAYGYVIHSFINAVKSGQNIKIYGTGNQSRDFIYIDDVTQTVEKLLRLKVESGSIISLGTGKAVAIKNLANLVMKVLNKKVNIDILEKRVEPYKSVSDTRFINKLRINSKKFTHLEVGIKNLINL